MQRNKDGQLKTKDGRRVPATQKGGLELLVKSWQADRYYRTWFGFGETRIQSVNVQVSVLRYWEGGAKFYPIFQGTAAETENKWRQIEELAKGYKYAEQPDPGEEKRGNLFARREDRGPGWHTYVPKRYTGNFTKWPNSMYIVGDGSTNSNTFIRWIVKEANHPFPAIEEWNPGSLTPSDPTFS